MTKSQVLFLARKAFKQARKAHKPTKGKFRIYVLARARCMDTKGRLDAVNP